MRAALLAVAITLLPAIAAAQQTVIFVRHAERADGGAGVADPMTGAPADPSLSAGGAARAAKLALVLADAGVKAIYTTEFKRTRETAQPLALKLGLMPETVTSKDTATLLSKARADHSRDTILVIGHSNTIPDLVRVFGGPALKIGDDEYTGIYILTPATGTLTTLRY
jgi:broad specificity phosphatase PhoE